MLEHGAVVAMTVWQRAGGRKKGLESAQPVDDDGQGPRQLLALLGHVVGKHRAQRRRDLEQAIVENHRSGFRNRRNLGKTVLNQFDLYRIHLNSPYDLLS